MKTSEKVALKGYRQSSTNNMINKGFELAEKKMPQ